MARVLIIEDNESIREVVADVLVSLNVSYAEAASQQEARELLGRERFDLILLDLEIPVKRKSLPRKQTGINLGQEIRRLEGYRDVPLVVMSSHSDWETVTSVLKGIADDFVGKPFKEHGQGKTLDDVIREHLFGGSEPGAASAEGTPQTFESGDLVFRENVVELEGAPVAGGEETTIRQILDVLAEPEPDGSRRYLPAKEIADRLEAGEMVDADVTSRIRDFREKVVEELAAKGISIGKMDVLANKRGRGYFLTEKVRIVQR